MKAVVVFLDDQQDSNRIVEFVHDIYEDGRSSQIFVVTEERMAYELLDFFQDPVEPPEEQIDRLARFITEQIPGEPSEEGGAVDCAIRLLASAYLDDGEKLTILNKVDIHAVSIDTVGAPGTSVQLKEDDECQDQTTPSP